MVGTEQDISGILAKEKLQERDRLEFTKKIEKINSEVKNVQEEMKKIGTQIQAVATSKGDSETLKKWDSMSDIEKGMSPVIPRNAYMTMLEAIFSDAENIPGLKRRVLDLMTKDDIENFLTEDPSGEKVAEAICTSDECKTKVREKVEEYQKEHGLKKEKKLF